MISCTSTEYREAYGWQRDGGMAPYLLAEEKDLVFLPDAITYTDGAQIACGFGPIGLASLMLSKALGANLLIGTDTVPERMELARELGLVHHVVDAGPAGVDAVLRLTGGRCVERAVDCSGSGARSSSSARVARLRSIRARICFTNRRQSTEAG